MKEPMSLVKGKTVDLLYPSDAEIVIEGRIEDVAKVEDEGNFGEYPRYYSGKKIVPFMEVTAMCLRRDAVYQDVIPAHNEHITAGALPRMGTYFQRIKANIPYIKMLNLPKSGSSRAIMYLSITKNSDGEGMHAGLAALAADPNVKIVVVVDDDIDVFNEEQVWWAVAFRFEADRNLITVPYTLGAHLNPSAYALKRALHGVLQTRMIFDATWPAKPFVPSPVARASAEARKTVEAQTIKEQIDGDLLKRLDIAPAQESGRRS
jgi:2,5-furandicarboxylate decarboxylase 1